MSKFATVKAVVDGKEVVIENVVGIEQTMGDVTTIYDICGGPHGNGPSICPDCRKKYKDSDKVSFCGKRFIADQIAMPGTITISTSITVDKIIEVKGGFNGIEWEAA